MRVLFDAFWWADGPMSNRTVQRELIRTWVDIFPGDEVILAIRSGAPVADLPPNARVVRTHLWPHALANRWELARLQKAETADIAVVHNYTPRRGRSAVFIHDVMFVDHPEWFSAAERVYFRPMLPWTRSAAVVATSTRTEAERIARLGPGGRVPAAIGLGVPPSLTGARPRRPQIPADVEQFALTVGRLNVRKNLDRILAAVASSTRLDARHPLIVVGTTAHSGVGTTLSHQVLESIDQGRIILLGGASDDELAWLYENTAVCVTLSRDEGFGLPAIEAARFNAPLVASDIHVFRETVGGYARFVDPDATLETIASAIDETFGTPVDGSAIQSLWTWERSVRALRAAILASM